jgi:chromosome segregation ATPase
MRIRSLISALLLALFLAGLIPAANPPAQAQLKKDYLSELEGDKIRDAETPNERIRLFLSFALDRLKKFQYELARTAPEAHRADMLNKLLSDYSSCLDDAADVLTVGVERQQDIRAGIKEMQARTKDFQETLEKIEKDAVKIDTYKESLQDAFESTKDAQADAEKAAKKTAPAPSRKKP